MQHEAEKKFCVLFFEEKMIYYIRYMYTELLLLSLSLLLSGMALAEDRDPNVGAWYFIYDKSIHPEFAEYFDQYEIGDTGTVFFVPYFASDGDTVALGDQNMPETAGKTPILIMLCHREITGMNCREQKAGICRNQKKERTV